MLQLETAPATTVAINPNIADTANHVQRLQRLQPKTTGVNDLITIAELRSEITAKSIAKNHVTCLAKVKTIQTNRNWYYDVCPRWSKKLYPVKGPAIKFVCEDDDNIGNLKFMYCVNATIIDETSFIDVVFFNEAMTTFLNITCEEMITTHGYSDQRELADNMHSIINKPKLMTLTVKSDNTIAVNNVLEPPTATLPARTITPTITLPPTTPMKRSHPKIKDKEA